MNTGETIFNADLPNKKIKVERVFAAPLNQVWQAWTTAEMLDQWWAPKPYRAETKSMDFREGGHWMYAMVGPDNYHSICREDYQTIVNLQSITNTVAFCDDAGVVNEDFPVMNWTKAFSADGDITKVSVDITFKSEADLETLVKMGFKEGFTAGLSNLDRYLSTQFQLRREMKPNNTPRVTTYLNFPGNTEEAFNFYREVFNGDFTGNGLTHFGDITLPEGMPTMSDADKKLIIHAELTIIGGHILMATDAPESMGFTLTPGDNMHINVEPASREETERLFNALSDGGKVIMPLQDMFLGSYFWNAYYAQLTDKYGINWMLNYQVK